MTPPLERLAVASAPLDSAQARPDVRFSEGTALHVAMVNRRHPLFAERAVRRAIALTIDRAELNACGWYGFATETSAVFPPRFGLACRSVRRDVAKAHAELDAAGWILDRRGVRVRNGQDLRGVLAVDQDAPDMVAMARAIRVQLMDIGIHLEVRASRRFDAYLESGTWAIAVSTVNCLGSGNYGMVADSFLALECEEDCAEHGNPRVEHLRAMLLVERDDLLRRDLAEALQAEIVADSVLIPLLIPPRISTAELLRLVRGGSSTDALRRLA